MVNIHVGANHGTITVRQEAISVLSVSMECRVKCYNNKSTQLR